MTRNYLADYDLLAVSAHAKETALNTEASLDTLMLVAKANLLQIDPRREDNSGQLTGKEEADLIYALGGFSGGPMDFEFGQPDHFAFGYSFALGVSTPGASGTGFKHTITPTASMDLPGFTAGMRIGKTIFKTRLASMFVDQLIATFAKDSWAKLALTIRGTGKKTTNMHKEIKIAPFNAASITLAALGVEGALPTDRLDSFHLARVTVPNSLEKQDVVVTAVSAATPAILSITPPTTAIAIAGLSQAVACVVTWVGHGLISTDKVTIAGITQADWTALNAEHIITYIGVDSFSIPIDTSAYGAPYDPGTDPGTIIESTNASYEFLYVPTEAGWMTFPVRDVAVAPYDESPLRVTDLVMKIGGKWNGTTILGGHTMGFEIDSIEHTINNNLLIEYRIGGTGTYANYVLRQGRVQTLKLNRQARDYILQQRIEDNEYFTVHILATGAEYATGENYSIMLLFPRCGILKVPLSVGGKILGEAGDLLVLEDDTYGSCKVEVINEIAAYAA